MDDFDFYTGTRDIANRRRADFFEETGLLEEARGVGGIPLRLYDPERQEWSLHWVSSRTGRLTPPVVGRFVDGQGEFYGDDTHPGKEIRVRCLWSGITAESAQWEQAFSIDGEKTWIMTSTRREASGR